MISEQELESILNISSNNVIKEFTTKNFQHKAGSVGELAVDLEDIEQCYETIINLTKGDIPFYHNLGTTLIEAIGENPADAEGIISKILKEEFTKQEPRGEVLELKTTVDTNGGFDVSVTFQSKLTKEIKERIYKL